MVSMSRVWVEISPLDGWKWQFVAVRCATNILGLFFLGVWDDGLGFGLVVFGWLVGWLAG